MRTVSPLRRNCGHIFKVPNLGRLSSFLRNLIAENVALFRPESALLVGWLSSLGPGFEETIKMLQSEAIPASAQVSSLPPGASSLDLLSYSAETIAEQLTLIDQHHLSGIRLSELSKEKKKTRVLFLKETPV